MINIQHANLSSSAGLDCFSTARFKSETLSLYFRLPVSKEESVIRSLLLSVLKRGCEEYPSQKAINIRLDELYAAIITLENRKYDREQLIGVSFDLIKKRYTENGEDLIPSALELMTQLLFHPLLDQNGCFLEEYVNSEKQNYKNIILSQINEPRSYSTIRCREETFAELDIFYTLSQTVDIIDSITPKELTDYYKNVVLNADRRAFYVGEADADGIAREFGKAVPETSGACGEIPSLIAKRLPPSKERRVVEERDLSQSRLVMSLDCGIIYGDFDYYAMLLCNEILGTSPIAKLMMQVRERLGLCYECSSSYDGNRGVIFINSGVDARDFSLAEEAILEQVNALKRGDISSAELDAAKKSLINVYKSIYDSPSAIERFYIKRIISGSRESVEDVISKIESVSLDGVVAAAQKLRLHTLYFLKGREDREVTDDE